MLVCLGGRHPHPTHVDDALRIAHHERAHLQVEEAAVLHGQVMGARNAHRTRLGVQAGRKRAQRVDPATDAMLGLEHDRIVALPLQLVRGHEPGHAGADDQDSLASAGPVLQAFAGHGEDVGPNRRLIGR
jgi:hypothetical protein